MTIDELLGLPPEAWEAISKMNDEELAVYLADITLTEPKVIPAEATPCISAEEDLMGETSDNNPIRMTKKRKDKELKKPKEQFSKEEIDDILKGL